MSGTEQSRSPARRIARSWDERAGRDAALELGPQPHVIVSSDGLLRFANLAARTLFGLSPEDLGRPLEELGLPASPAALRAAIEAALRNRRRAGAGPVAFGRGSGEERRLEVAVVPLVSGGAAVHGVSLLFEDVTRTAGLERELDAQRREIAQAYGELQCALDELANTSHELRAAHAGLQTTSEELRSATEELETISDELRDRTAELDRLSELLATILTSLGVAVAVLDREGRVQLWSRRAEDLWGLRADQAMERDFLSLDIDLPTSRLAHGLRAALRGGSARERVELQTVNRRGRPITCTTTMLPLLRPEGDRNRSTGAILLMQDGPPAGVRGDGERGPAAGR